MEKYEVKQIYNLLSLGLDSILKQSTEEGFRFVERLIVDYKNGSNLFNLTGEGLFGVFSEEDVLVAIGGLNKDPFSNEISVGRIRRVYVSKDYRRHGIGSLLITNIIVEAKRYYKTIVLHTDTEQGDRFYTSLGFSKRNLHPNSSHFMEINN